MKKETKWMIGMGVLLAAAAATAIYLRRNQKRTAADKPPKDAPQLQIDNPGTQAEFPSSATESEVG